MIIDFTNQEMAILSTALGQLPYIQVAPLINKINKQILATEPPKDGCEQLADNGYFDA